MVERPPGRSEPGAGPLHPDRPPGDQRPPGALPPHNAEPEAAPRGDSSPTSAQERSREAVPLTHGTWSQRRPDLSTSDNGDSEGGGSGDAGSAQRAKRDGVRGRPGSPMPDNAEGRGPARFRTDGAEEGRIEPWEAAARRSEADAEKRAFEFVVDREHARAVNEVVADTRKLRVLAFTTTVVLGLGTAGLIWLDHPYSFLLAVAFGLGTVTSLFVALWTPHRARIEKLYAEGELVPAIVSDRHPRGALLLALVNLAKSGAAPRYALITRTVRSLPGHRSWPGEQIPSVTVRADRAPLSVGGLRQSVGAMPIAWGTRDPEVIARARDAIPAAEWKLLADNRSLADKVRTADFGRLLLDPHQLPEELRG